MFSWKNKDLSSIDKRKALANTGSYAILLLALGAMTFFGVCDPQQGSVRLSGAAASVADERIDGTEFRRYYNYYLRQLGSSQENFNAAQFGLANKLLEMFINNRVSYLIAEQSGFVVADSQIHEALINNPQFEDKSGQFSVENFKNFLKMNGFSESSYTEEQRRAMSVQDIDATVGTAFYVSSQDAEWEYQLSETKYDVSFVRLQSNQLKVPVTGKEVQEFLAKEENVKKAKDYFETNKSDYETEAERKARHILVGFEGARNATGEASKRTKEEAKKRAEQLLKKAQAKEADFTAIAKANTDEPSGKTSGGDLGWFNRKRMVKEFSDAAFSLAKGEVSGVIESPFGFHIIKVEGVKEAKKTEFAEVKTAIARKLVENERRPAFVEKLANEIVASLAKPKALAELLKKNNLKWDNTGEFAVNAKYIPTLGGDSRIKDAVMALRKPGDTVSAPIKAGENFFILKLDKLTKPDMSKLGDERMDELKTVAAMRRARQIFMAIKEQKEQELKDKKQIWKNPDYLALDKPRSNT